MPDHVHMLVSIPPKISVEFYGYWKVKVSTDDVWIVMQILNINLVIAISGPKGIM